LRRAGFLAEHSGKVRAGGSRIEADFARWDAAADEFDGMPERLDDYGMPPFVDRLPSCAGQDVSDVEPGLARPGAVLVTARLKLQWSTLECV
jgi:hypothetical protein